MKQNRIKKKLYKTTFTFNWSFPLKLQVQESNRRHVTCCLTSLNSKSLAARQQKRKTCQHVSVSKSVADTK